MRSSLSVSLAQNVGVSGPMILDLNQNIIDLILSQNDHLSVVGVENQHLKVHRAEAEIWKKLNIFGILI